MRRLLLLLALLIFCLPLAAQEDELPDGEFIAMTLTCENSESQVFLVSPNGETVIPRDGEATGWTPDGEALGATDPVDFSDISDTITEVNMPALSPDGTQVAFIAEGSTDPTTTNTLTLLDIETGTETVLEDRLHVLGDLAWSPDGTQLAFTATVTYVDNAGSDIYLIGTDGSNVRNVTNFPGDETQPAWSADGERLAFVYAARDFDDVRLVVMDANGLGAYVLVNGMAEINAPAWRPVMSEAEIDTENVPESLAFGVIAEVSGNQGALRLRETPTVAGVAITAMPIGTQIDVIGASQDADGYTWWPLRLEDGRTGWAVESAGGDQTLTPVAYANIARQPAQIPCE